MDIKLFHKFNDATHNTRNNFVFNVATCIIEGSGATYN